MSLCPAINGTYTSDEAMVERIHCRAGTRSFIAEDERSRCQECTYGWRQADTGHDVCIECAVGTYSHSAAIRCTECAHMYAAVTGSTACFFRDTGTVPTPNHSACLLCGPGQYADNLTATCAPCTSGRYPHSSCLCTWYLRVHSMFTRTLCTRATMQDAS